MAGKTLPPKTNSDAISVGIGVLFPSEIMTLEKVNPDNLALALATAKAVFPYELRDGKMSMEEAYVEAIGKDWPHFAYYIAKDEGRIIGITGHYPPEDDSKEIWLGWFGVLPDARGHGWGTMILHETCRIVASLGATEMHIYSGDRPEERKAHALYIRNGFKHTGNGSVAGEPVLFFRGPVPPNTTPEDGNAQGETRRP